MRIALLSAATLIGVGYIGTLSVPARAQSNPNAEQIVRSLAPTTTMGPSRGVRIAPTSQGPTAASGSTPAAPPPTHSTQQPSASLSVLFATGSAVLTPEAIKTLDELGKALTDPRLASGKFRIEGHTDTVGTADSNKALSAARAKAVADYLASTYRVAAAKLDAVGMGEEGLLVKTPPQTPEIRNRRVVVVNLGG